jgi:hypothetical protein
LDAEELAQLIEELETRVERLRAVYDQYFMGIERLEPLVMRKDVDRRLWILRREQIRNTGMRFKLQTTIQRYNTYQQYWARIVREIENGTYQRDLGRAAARFGENAVTAFGKRRQKMFEKGAARKAEREAARRGTTSSSPPPPDDQAPPDESFDVAFEDSDVFADAIAAPRVPLELDADEPPTPRTRRPISTPPHGSPAMVPPQDIPTPRHGSFPPPPMPKAASEPPPAPAAAASPPSRPSRRPAGKGALPPVQAPPKRPPTAPAATQMKPPVDRLTPPVGTGTNLTAEGELSPARLRQIYGQYVEAKRKANESTAAITYDKIAANLRETAKQLRSKHKGRNVDFEVVMKNGKPVLKPIVKG